MRCPQLNIADGGALHDPEASVDSFATPHDCDGIVQTYYWQVKHLSL